MFDTSDEPPVRRPRRIEVITGPERRRDWPDPEKIAIVAEALGPGVNVSEIARRHDIRPQQLFGWRRRFRVEAEALIAARGAPAKPVFAPVIVEATPLPATAVTPPGAATASEAASIEMTIGSATLRIRGAADAKTLALVLKALRSLA